jgi:hypothetical protein
MMNMEVYTADHFLRHIFMQQDYSSTNYVRAQKVTDLGMDKIGEKDIQNLKDAGNEMYNDPDDNDTRLPRINCLIETIIEERYGDGSKP